MPVSYIDVPRGVSPAGKEELVKDVFEAIHAAYPIPDTRVLIREWPPESVSQDGEIDLQPMRPICALEVPPGLPVAHKRKLIQRISAAISEACQLPEHEVPFPSGTVITTHWVLIFFPSRTQRSMAYLLRRTLWFSKRCVEQRGRSRHQRGDSDAKRAANRRGSVSAWF